jgi:hypothetical protein
MTITHLVIFRICTIRNVLHLLISIRVVDFTQTNSYHQFNAVKHDTKTQALLTANRRLRIAADLRANVIVITGISDEHSYDAGRFRFHRQFAGALADAEASSALLFGKQFLALPVQFLKWTDNIGFIRISTVEPG